MGSASSFGWGGRRQIEATGENEHPSFPDLFYKFFCGQQRNMQQESQFCQRIISVSPRTQPCCKEYFCLQKMFWMQPANGIQYRVCDFCCCSQIKCIRAICGTRLGQPQPCLVLQGSLLLVEFVSLLTSFCLGSKSNRRLPMQPQVHQASMLPVAMM